LCATPILMCKIAETTIKNLGVPCVQHLFKCVKSRERLLRWNQFCTPTAGTESIPFSEVRHLKILLTYELSSRNTLVILASKSRLDWNDAGGQTILWRVFVWLVNPGHRCKSTRWYPENSSHSYSSCRLKCQPWE